MEQKTFQLVLRDVKEIAPKVRHFAFMREDNQALSFIPGQFITLRLQHNDKIVRRSYSIASLGDLVAHPVPPSPLTFLCKSTSIEFAASYLSQGIASEFLFDLKPGDSVTATGPFGRLILRDDDPKRYFLIATGTGVTPYRAMLPELRERFLIHPNLKVVLFLGVYSPEHALYLEDFKAFQQEQPQFECHAFYSRAEPSQSTPFEHQGHVQQGFEKFTFSPAHDLIYLCGNPNMIDNAFAYFQSLGFSSSSVRREKYISS